MPNDVRKVCRLADISAKSVLLQIVRQGDPQKMLALVEKIASQGPGPTREHVRNETRKPKPGRPKAFTFNFRPTSKAFSLRLSFAKKSASKEEVISALENILDELRRSE
jgi:ParB family chromosome partitioning protein